MAIGLPLTLSLETIKACYTCFKCIGICPVGLRPNLFVKAYISSFIQEFRDVYEGIVKDSSIWTCARCLKCVEVCPQRVPLFDIVEYLQHEASKLGLAPPAYLNMVENTMNTYIAFTGQMIVTREGDMYMTEEARSIWGLAPIPEPQDIEYFKSVLKELKEVDQHR